MNAVKKIAVTFAFIAISVFAGASSYAQGIMHITVNLPCLMADQYDQKQSEMGEAPVLLMTSLNQKAVVEVWHDKEMDDFTVVSRFQNPNKQTMVCILAVGKGVVPTRWMIENKL